MPDGKMDAGKRELELKNLADLEIKMII